MADRAANMTCCCGPSPTSRRRSGWRPGGRCKLRFVNEGRATFSFCAPRFFRAARMRRRDATLAATAASELAPGERRMIALVPAPGRYRARSGNLIHRMLGMSAEIIVE